MEIDAISLFEPECGAREIELVNAVLQSSRWGDGPMLEGFEQAFAGWVGRKYAVAVGSGIAFVVWPAIGVWAELLRATVILSLLAFEEAARKLVTFVEHQRMVWLEGVHLPQSIALSPKASGLTLVR